MLFAESEHTSKKAISNPLFLRTSANQAIELIHLLNISKIVFLFVLYIKTNITNSSNIILSYFMGVLRSFRGCDANILKTPSQHNSTSLSNAFQIRTGFEARTNFPWSPQVKEDS